MQNELKVLYKCPIPYLTSPVTKVFPLLVRDVLKPKKLSSICDIGIKNNIFQKVQFFIQTHICIDDTNNYGGI